MSEKSILEGTIFHQRNTGGFPQIQIRVPQKKSSESHLFVKKKNLAQSDLCYSGVLRTLREKRKTKEDRALVKKQQYHQRNTA